ncbi:hypothetical protein LJC27_07385 [Christensenellaceae bacterium OttesenSCG-928-M15]|nr:hypothetical protein [Christensenellaceae bacterium OttesenSCG-928-M15]
MKLVDLQFKKVKIQLNFSFKVAFGEINYSENILLRATTDEGITGYGEASYLPFVTGETADGVLSALHYLRPALLGSDPFSIDRIHQIMDGTIHANPSAKCAVDLAMYDIMGKVLGKPVYRLLGGANGTVQNDVTIGIGNPEEMAKPLCLLVKLSNALYTLRQEMYQIDQLFLRQLFCRHEHSIPCQRIAECQQPA